MLFLKKKRGSVAPLMLAFEVLVAFFVMTTLIQVSKGYAEQGFYRKAYIAKDISMIADASFAYDGNVEAIYPVETKNYFIDLNENQVKVYTEKEREQAKIGYSFVKPVNIFIEGQILKNPPKIEAVRSGNRFSLNKKQSINLLDCSQLDTSGRIEEKKIMIDSSHGYTDFGNQRTILKDSNIVELKESEINKQIALAVTIPKILYTYDVSRELSQELTLADRLKIVQQQNPNILITIHVGSYSSEQNKITA
ncbi:MAG TPA: N-acetylmuramoyl-L-alanine amidase [Candidatus Nanoarchaeia archaeon]|nr:N-acetylmuramoyl-L-alanine amidase [Candidatus Nanoarchaeia archaeon]